jgi:SAM-dependent methyltransferase
MRISVSKHIKSPLVRQLIYGLSSLLMTSRKGTGGTSSAEYCYSVYLRHLVVAQSNGLFTDPKVIAEIGPGDSLGIGLASMLTGTEQYFAFDVINHVNNESNLAVFDRLVELFQKRTPIPSQGVFEGILPTLQTDEFPSHILTAGRLEKTLHPDRIAHIRNGLVNAACSQPDGLIQYFAPWDKLARASVASVDLVISQAVMEHVDDLAEAYNACFRWLRPGGFMSHQIDFGCHDTADEWNGHWAYSDLVWGVIRGARSWLLNRHCYSEHMEMINRAGFEIVHTNPTKGKGGIHRSRLSRKFQHLSDEDLATSSVLIQARKPQTV